MSTFPEYARTSVHIYVTNPDASSEMSVTGRLDLKNLKYESFAQKAIKDFNKLTGRDDSRLMTKDEVQAYLENDED